MPKKKKTPEEIALKKALKAEASGHVPMQGPNPTTQSYNATNASMHPTFDYNMQQQQQQAYGNTGIDYNSCNPAAMGGQMQGDPNASMYYNDHQMIKYEQSQNVQPYHATQGAGATTGVTNYHHTHHQNDFTNQYYMQQQPQAPPVQQQQQQQDTSVCWNNMQMYNNGAAQQQQTPPVDNMSYYANANAAGAGMPDVVATNDKHQQQQLMNIPNTDLFYSQDNLWNHTQHHHHPHHPHTDPAAVQNHHGNTTYNNIGNILTNLELIGNNSNFENNFDIVTSQGMQQGGQGPEDPTQQHQQHQQNMADYQLFDYAPGFQ